MGMIHLCYGQESIPQIIQAEISDGKITRFEQYEGSSLWGYIDGGADIYFEYGFNNVTVQKIFWRKHQFKIDMYEMNTPEGAFGIYSVSHHKCITSDTLIQFGCFNPHQLQFVLGKYYISIVNDNGTVEEQKLSSELSKLLLRKIKQNDIELPDIFLTRTYFQYRNQLKFLKGRLGVQNGFPEWEEILDSIKDYACYILPIEMKKGRILTAQIKLSRESDKDIICRKLQIPLEEGKSSFTRTTGGITKSVRLLSPLKLIYFETNLPSEETKQYKNIFDLIR